VIESINSTSAVVTTYSPENSPSSSVVELAQTLIDAGVPVLVTDDASPCTADPVLRQLAGITGGEIEVIRHSVNRGIARGLNEGLQWARERGARWLLTLDQDSVIDGEYVRAITEFADSWESLWGESVRIGAVGAGHVVDDGGELKYPITIIASGDRELSCTEEVIQSGTLWSVAALTLVGGFDESLGIDAVDAAACLRLREQGYRIALAPDLVVYHQLGDSRPVQIFGRTVLATGHSGARRATMMRNRLRLAPAEFRQSPKHAFRTLRRVGVNAVLGVTVENDRWEKAKGSIRGLRGKGTNLDKGTD
jgi:rhamnosyltransferase